MVEDYGRMAGASRALHVCFLTAQISRSRSYSTSRSTSPVHKTFNANSFILESLDHFAVLIVLSLFRLSLTSCSQSAFKRVQLVSMFYLTSDIQQYFECTHHAQLMHSQDGRLVNDTGTTELAYVFILIMQFCAKDRC
jgi:hypothetical protein